MQLFQKLSQFIIQYLKKKVTLINITTNLTRKALGIKKRSGSPWLFQNSDFMSKLNFYHWLQIPFSFPWNTILTLFIFKKMSAEYPSQNNHSSSPIVASSQNGERMRKVTDLNCNSNNCTVALFWDKHYAWIWSRRNALWTPAILSCRIL